MHTLFPAIKPYCCHELAVSNTHTLYVEEVGNPDGRPVLIIHPGPGAGGDTYLRRFFDPQIFRIILFDQRGCGRSTPHLERAENTTQNLIEDIDAIRDFLGLNRLILSGGGWGSLLALLYAEQYPHYICGLLLHRVFLGRQQDVDWFYRQGANLIYPDYWQEFTNGIPSEELASIPFWYAKRMESPNELARMAAAKNWAMWLAHCSSLQPHQNLIDQYSDVHFALSLATLESHYIINNYFISENEVLANAAKIRHIPTFIIHGRYDMVCPLAGAWALHEALSASSLSIVRDAGHSDREAGIIDAIIAASQKLSQQSLDAC